MIEEYKAVTTCTATGCPKDDCIRKNNQGNSEANLWQYCKGKKFSLYMVVKSEELLA